MLQVDECTMNSHEYVLFRFGFDACSFVRSFVRAFVRSSYIFLFCLALAVEFQYRLIVLGRNEAHLVD